jgi:hypothetical protein
MNTARFIRQEHQVAPLRFVKGFAQTLIAMAISTQLYAADFDGNIVLGAPTETSITANVLTATSQDIYLSFSSQSGIYSNRTSAVQFSAGAPDEIHITGLAPDTRYYYRLNYNEGGNNYLSTQELSFHTPREAGSSFVFGVQGDSHPERAPRDFIPELYTRTLTQAKNDGVDFLITTGDDFSIDLNYPNGITEDDVIERYRIQRPWLGVVGDEAPVFLVNGNHEQGALYLYNDARKYPAPENPAVWVQNARNEYFTQPEPNDFYTGNDEELRYIDKGLKGTYYAFEWGDALFVTLDPFWSSEAVVDNLFEGPRGGGQGQPQGAASRTEGKTVNKWDMSLGDAQYNWLKETLEESDATFKFIFTHMMHGGDRGGVEQANLYEWGGEGRTGEYEFDTERPNWEKPIHQLMADTNVSVFFHAHDHVWVMQELDGVIYQEVGSPADPDYTLTNWAGAYVDETSVVLPNTGYTRVSVSSEQVKVDYVRIYLPNDENEEHISGEVSYNYVISPPED